jgi:nucleoside-diphosphate-sugar epimerase
LVEEGYLVHVLLKSTSNRWRLADIRSKLVFHETNLAQSDQVLKTVKKIRPSVIYHLAAHGAYPSQQDAAAIWRTNIIGTWNLLAACDQTGYDLFVNTGSSSEYGRRRTAMRETDRVEPDSLYAVAKVAQTLMCCHHARQHDKPITTFRIFSAYGPYEEPSRLIPRLCMAMLNSEPIDMANPRTARDFIYVEDVIRAYRTVKPLYPLRGEVINLGTGVQSTLAQVVSELEHVARKSMTVRWNAMPARQWDKSTWVADVRHLQEVIRKTPRTTLRQGLAKSLAWFRTHQEGRG